MPALPVFMLLVLLVLLAVVAAAVLFHELGVGRECEGKRELAGGGVSEESLGMPLVQSGTRI